jgi:putative heme-binding domain-containing protein
VAEEQLAKLPPQQSRQADKNQLAKTVLSGLPEASAQRGKWSFNGICATCHSAKSEDGAFRLGPNLASIGAASQPRYLIESILEPSKVLKTGFQIETIETSDGKVYSGQIETRDQDILIKRVGAPPVTVPMARIKKRTTSHVSPMPDGLYNEMTIKELADLTAYLMTLKGGN